METGARYARGRRRTTASLLALALLILVASAVASGCGPSAEKGGANREAAEKQVGKTIDAGLPQMTLLKPPVKGAGEVPRFEWEAFRGAASYRLVVLDAKGKAVWAWTGKETAVNLGGLPGKRPADVSGPIITPDSSWSVTALSKSGEPIGVSRLRPISP